MTNNPEYDFSDLRPDELNSTIAGLTALNKRSDEALKAAKEEWRRSHDGGDEERAVFAGLDAGEISLSKGTEGHYVVVDERAYGAMLHDSRFLIPGGNDAAEAVWMPRPEAKSEAYLKNMIADHDGELPPGVEFKPGRAQTVTFRAARGFVDKAFTSEIAPKMFRMLTATKEE